MSAPTPDRSGARIPPPGPGSAHQNGWGAEGWPALAPTVERLCASSRRTYVNPYEAISWPDTLDRETWCTSPELVSLYGTATWESLDERDQKRLSFWEAVNFYSLNIHGERSLLEGLARRLYEPRLAGVADYLHHMLDEENKHSVWFGTFCRRYAGKVYPDRTVAFPRDHDEGEEDFLFFAQVMVFEEVVDRQNLRMARDERLHPVAREINARHHDDEVRHLIFGREVVAALWERHAPRWPPATVDRVRGQLSGYFSAMWRDYYRPEVYRDAGLTDPWRAHDEAWAHPASRERRQALAARCVRFLLDRGILVAEPAL